jgi:hypothetical protein
LLNILILYYGAERAAEQLRFERKRSDILILVFTLTAVRCTLTTGTNAMSYSSAATAVAYSPGTRTERDDLISHLLPVDAWTTVMRLRFLPLSYLMSGKVEWDPGIDQLLYVQSFIDEEE